MNEGKSIVEQPLAVMTLCGLSAMTALSVEILLPSIGPIARDLDVPDATASLLIGLYFLSYGLGQLFWGALSDRFGRKPMLYLGLTLFALASLGCALAPSFEVLLGFRLVQGFAGAAPVIARAIVRDVGAGPAAARLMAALASVTAIAPMLGPAVGSGLLVFFDWRAPFVLLIVFSGLFLAAARLWLPETLTRKNPSATNPGHIWRSTVWLWGRRDFVVGTCVAGFAFAGFASVLALGSLVGERAYGIAPESFGALYAIAAVFQVVGALFMRRYVVRLGLSGVGWVAIGFLALAVLMHGWFMIETPGFPAFWAGVAVYMLGFGIALPVAQTIALRPAEGMAGFAVSIHGTSLMIIAAIVASVATAFYDGDHQAISLTMAVMGALAVLVFAVGRRAERRAAAAA